MNEYTDEELFLLDLKFKNSLITDDKLVKLLEEALVDISSFKSKIKNLRLEYKFYESYDYITRLKTKEFTIPQAIELLKNNDYKVFKTETIVNLTEV